MRENFLPFAKPDISDEDLSSVLDSMKTGWLSRGPLVSEFEQKLSEYINVPYVLAVNSGTAALHLAMLASGIGPGDEVIVPSFTFCSTVNVVELVGAKTVFADISNDNYCLDIEDVERKITRNTKAVILVHYGGQTTDVQRLSDLCKKNNILLIEDAAHAIETKYRGEQVGNLGDISCFSFYATKNITTGEGGAFVTKDKDLFESAKMLGWHGVKKSAWNRYSKNGSWAYEVVKPGYKYNMTDTQASLGLSQLKRAKMMQVKRQHIAERYAQGLNDLNNLIILPYPKMNRDVSNSWHLYPIRITSKSTILRDEFIEKMKENNIGTSVHFIPNHLQPYYQEKYGVKLPNTEPDLKLKCNI